MSRAAGPAQVTPSSARPWPVPPGWPPASAAARRLWGGADSLVRAGQRAQQRAGLPAGTEAEPCARAPAHPRGAHLPPRREAPRGCSRCPGAGRPRQHHESPLVPAFAAPPGLRCLLGRCEQLAVSWAGTGGAGLGAGSEGAARAGPGGPWAGARRHGAAGARTPGRCLDRGARGSLARSAACRGLPPATPFCPGPARSLEATGVTGLSAAWGKRECKRCKRRVQG